MFRPSRAMRVRVVIAVAFGLAVSLLLAMGCELWSQREWDRREPIPAWPPGTPSEWPTPHTELVVTGHGVRERFYSFNDRENLVRYTAACIESGWPMRCLTRTVWAETVPGSIRLEDITVRHTPSVRLPVTPRRGNSMDMMVFNFPIAAMADHLKHVGVTPLWVGLLANTLAFGTPVYLLMAGAASIRRLRRRRAKLCECCAYPVAGDVCSECGTHHRVAAAVRNI